MRASTKTWTDITELATEAAASLEEGELLASDHFTLFEAMSALELMDPKMDSHQPKQVW